MSTLYMIATHMTSQSWPPKSKFNIDDIPDLTGKVAVVTGGYAGVGKETVFALLRRNAKVYIAGRTPAKAEAAIRELKERTGKDALFLELDLANLRAVRKAATSFQSQEKQLHLLFNNGGVMIPPVEQVTSDGYDLQFGTNCLGHWYFTQLLMPTLLETAKTAPKGTVRVITTSSLAHIFHGPGFNWETMKKGNAADAARKKLGTHKLYAQSKFGDIVIALELAKRYGDQGIVSISCNPGNLDSDLFRHMNSVQHKLVRTALLQPPSMGALTQLWGGTMPEAASLNGEYLIPWARVGPVRKDVRDPKAGEELWKWLEDQVKDIRD